MTRREDDAYYTHEALVLSLVRHIGVHQFEGKRICEPCVGQGHIPSAMFQFIRGRLMWTTNDVKNLPSAGMIGDATNPNARIWQNEKPYDWVITNPPFSNAAEILRLSLKHANNVAMLVRLSFLEPTMTGNNNRGDLLSANADRLGRVIIFGSPRPSFTDDGRTDSVTTCWLVFQKSRWYPNLLQPGETPSWTRMSIDNMTPLVFENSWKQYYDMWLSRTFFTDTYGDEIYIP